MCTRTSACHYRLLNGKKRRIEGLQVVTIRDGRGHLPRDLQETLALPFVPDLEAVHGRSIDSTIAADVDCVQNENIRIAQSYTPKEDHTTDFTRVDRTINNALTCWMRKVKPEVAPGRGFRLA